MKKLMILAGSATMLLATATTASAGPSGFAGLLEPYEAVRQALVADDLAAVRAPADRLAEATAHLGHHLTAESAGVPAEKLAAVRQLLPEIETAAASLATAGDLVVARDAFLALSEPLVRWRQAAGSGPVVVYCSMKKGAWLQPTSENIGNPYYGKKMETCGSVVSN